MPITAFLREHLAVQRLWRPPGIALVFGTAPHRPVNLDRMRRRADAAWQAAGLTRLTLHDCRHTFATFAIAVGWNAKALCSLTSGTPPSAITFDRYGHLMPGSENGTAGLLDVYLEARR